jgi:hypothetical protein
MKDAFVRSASHHAWGVVLGIGPVLRRTADVCGNVIHVLICLILSSSPFLLQTKRLNCVYRLYSIQLPVIKIPCRATKSKSATTVVQFINTHSAIVGSQEVSIDDGVGAGLGLVLNQDPGNGDQARRYCRGRGCTVSRPVGTGQTGSDERLGGSGDPSVTGGFEPRLRVC